MAIAAALALAACGEEKKEEQAAQPAGPTGLWTLPNAGWPT